MVEPTCVVGVAMAVLSHVQTDYLNYINNMEDNLALLRKELGRLCDLKHDLLNEVENGENRQERRIRQVNKWLNDVQRLCNNEKLRELMHRDMGTAKWVVKIMDTEKLKKCMGSQREMQEFVVKVMKMLQEEADDHSQSKEMRETAKEDYDKVAEAVLEMMMDNAEEVRILMKQEPRLAVIATRKLSSKSLSTLINGEKEMEEIVLNARNASSEDSLSILEDEAPVASVSAPAKEFISLRDLKTNINKVMDDPRFKKVVPKAEFVKICLNVMDGLWKTNMGFKQELDNNIVAQKSPCCYLADRYHVSKAARDMATLVTDDHINHRPKGALTAAESTPKLNAMPSNFLKDLESRNNLLHQTLNLLNDDQVKVVGLVGMGGIGKSVLAKEIHIKAELSGFKLIVNVEVTHNPDIKNIQSTIASSISTPLIGTESIAHRARVLLDKLNKCKQKGLKILVILDDIWKKLNLDEIGIPSGACKLVLVARNKDVCRFMGVTAINMLKVDLINATEARLLFKSHMGNQVDIESCKNVVDKLLSSCEGLPLTIETIADSLKDKDLCEWEKTANRWTKPISSHDSSYYKDTYPRVLGTSFKFMTDKKRRIFFLLASLFPRCSNIPIDTLMMYGIGLGLYDHVNNVPEALDTTTTWVKELVSSSILSEGHENGTVKIHSIVRACAIIFAAKEENHSFLVDAIPRWTVVLDKFTAMSLAPRQEYTRLLKMDVSNKLQILKLRGNASSKFADDVFEKMLKLQVLHLSNMDFHSHLPNSIWKLEKLITLCLESCKLGDIRRIGELADLRVISLRESFVEQLPCEIGDLDNLYLLDLTGCTSNKVSLIPADTLKELTGLGGLYPTQVMVEANSSDKGTLGGLYPPQVMVETNSSYEGTSAVENYGMPNLKTCEIEEVTSDGQYAQDQPVEQLRVCVGAS